MLGTPGGQGPELEELVSGEVTPSWLLSTGCGECLMESWAGVLGAGMKDGWQGQI